MKSQFFWIVVIIVIGVVAFKYVSKKNANPEQPYYYPVPEPGKGSNPLHIKGG